MPVQGGFISPGKTDLDDLFVGRSFDFDGINEYVGLGNISELDFDNTDPFSLTMWWKMISPAPVGTHIFISKQLNALPLTGWNVFINSVGQLFFQLIANTANFISVRGTATFTFFNQWYHLGITYDGSSLASGVTFYIIGVVSPNVVGSDTLTLSSLNSAPAQISSRFGNVTFLHRGRLADVAVWGKELSAAEIAEFGPASGEVAVKASEVSFVSDLVGYWPILDSDVFPNVTDQSGNGNDGTMAMMEPSDLQLDSPLNSPNAF